MNNNQGRRRTRRVRQQRKQKSTQISRILLTICMMALVAVVSIGGTLAWLQAETQTVTNTFATTGIKLTLKESEYSVNEAGKDVYSELKEAPVTNNAYRLIPGKKYTKNPTVEVVDLEDKDVDVYLFVEFDEGTSKTYLDYTSTLSADYGWTPLTEAEDNKVWYREVAADAAESDRKFELILRNEVQVKTGLAKETMASEDVIMTYKAYAIQKNYLTSNGTEVTDAAGAWAIINAN